MRRATWEKEAVSKRTRAAGFAEVLANEALPLRELRKL